MLVEHEGKVPAAEEQDDRQVAHRDDMQILAQEEHAELHGRILGVKAADQLLLGFGQVKGQPVGLGEGADQEEQEPDRLHEHAPDPGGPAS